MARWWVPLKLGRPMYNYPMALFLLKSKAIPETGKTKMEKKNELFGDK